ncbi:hypothetical protein BD626DRAFT_451495, partial [Schizophyllum amplum]
MGDTNNHIEDLWFPDGNIIIRVGERVCRVYKGFLATQSPVLADMFSFPQPDGADTVDGLPVVTFPDEPEEVLYWLKAMMVPGYFDMDRHRIYRDRLFAVLRLSHKYDVRHLRRRSLEYLAGLLPVNVKTFQDDRYTYDTIPGHYKAPLGFYPPVHAIAHEVGALWLIPGIIFKMHDVTSWDDPDEDKPDNMHELLMPLNATFLARMDRIPQLIARHFPADNFISLRKDCPRLRPEYDDEPSCDTQWYDLDRWLRGLHAHPLSFYN